MNVSKMDHAMLSFGLMGGLLVPRPQGGKRRGWLTMLLNLGKPRPK